MNEWEKERKVHCMKNKKSITIHSSISITIKNELLCINVRTNNKDCYVAKINMHIKTRYNAQPNSTHGQLN